MPAMTVTPVTSPMSISDMDFGEQSPLTSLLFDDIDEALEEEVEFGGLFPDAEDLLGMTEQEFDTIIESMDTHPEIKSCISDMIQQLEIRKKVVEELSNYERPHAMTRSNSLRSNGLQHTEAINIEEMSWFSEEETPDFSSESSESSSESEPEEEPEQETDVASGDETDDEDQEPQYKEQYLIAMRTASELRTEVEHLRTILELKKREIGNLRNELKRKRDTEEEVEVVRPKRMKMEGCRHGCPFCEWEANTSDIRDIRDHLTNGDCQCPTDQMIHSHCNFENKWCTLGMNGYECLIKLGFKDPENHVESFRHFKCPKCDFRHFQASKFLRHLKKKRGNGCGFSPEEAKMIKDEQCRRKKCCSPVSCAV